MNPPVPIRPIRRLLIANRGEIARRVRRTATEMGITTVAVFTDPDADAPHVLEADLAVRLSSDHGDGPSGHLDGAAVIAAAVRTGADAIHPGYGYLSENAAFARSVIEAGLVWVGPSPEVIATMGDKLDAKAVADAAGVPTLPSATDAADAEAVGFPLLVKASAGGGGKGMRVVTEPAALGESVAAARREAGASFGDDTVFFERYVERAHHIEIQLLGDHHGNLIHLGERECSIQRRHQKIIEEAPSPLVDDDLRERMGAAALALGRRVGYASAGTVEFLVDEDTREFHFLEVNTRLQVEHPVTEAVTGIDLVRAQIRIAEGHPLGLTQAEVSFTGHAIEARLCAEDPSADFLPATGHVDAFSLPTEPDLRWDSGVEASSTVGLDFDPLLAKVVSHAESREEAAARLALGLDRLHMGGVTTNAAFLARVLRHDRFVAGRTTTAFLADLADSLQVSLPDEPLIEAAAIATLWWGERTAGAAQKRGGPSHGWTNGRLPAERTLVAIGGTTVAIEHRHRRDGSAELVASIGATHGGRTSFTPDEPTDGAMSADAIRATDDRLDVTVDGVRRRYAMTGDRHIAHVQLAGGTVTVAALPRFEPPGVRIDEGSLVAPMPGTVLQVMAEPGDRVGAGEVVVVLEAMKMEHHIRAPSEGVIAEIGVARGDQVVKDQLLLVLADDPDTPASHPDRTSRN